MAKNNLSKSITEFVTLIPSSVMVGAFFLIPFILIILASLSAPTPDGDYAYALNFSHFERFATWFYVERAIYSTAISAFIAVVCLIVAYPFTYMLTRFKPKTKTVWLIYILAQLSLSEVLLAFSWQIIFSRTSGLSNIFVWLGMIDKPFSMIPSAGAVITGLVCLALPFAILLLFPALSRLDKSFTEAARTMGASPVKAFLSVVIPNTKSAIISTGVTVFVLTLGAIIVPQILGAPKHWTLSVIITDQAISQFNLPFASALAMVLLGMSALVIGLVMRFKGND